MPLTSQEARQYEEQFSAHNYHPLPVVFHKAKGCEVWDPEGNRYLDFLSAYSAVNQGHCHPRIVKALCDQAQQLTLSSRAFSSDAFAEYAQFVTEFFGYEMVLPMNTGAEAVETALKLARRWGYDIKKIPEDQAIILGASGNFHGRTLGAISLSTEADSRDGFGPFVPGATSVPSKTPIRYGVIEDLKSACEINGDRIAAIILEPIQGEAGIVVPPKDYLRQVQELCHTHNILFICDEIQTGIGRTGKLLCYQHTDGVRPDLLLLGKALSGGTLPVSCVLSSKKIMLTLPAGSHGSTFGGSPLASRVAIEALKVIQEERLVENAREMGNLLIAKLNELKDESDGMISEVRGRGLLTAIVIDPKRSQGRTAWDLCLLMKDRGILAKPTHDHIIRLAPPLVITREMLLEGVQMIKSSLKQLTSAPISGH